MLGPVPLDGELDEPTLGVVGGYGELVEADPARPWMGGRWVVRTESGARLPLTLSMLLFDSSGANKDAARREHCEAMQKVIVAARHADADPHAVVCALGWLLYDWLMARREGPDSAEIVFPKGREGDAAVVVSAARHRSAPGRPSTPHWRVDPQTGVSVTLCSAIATSVGRMSTNVGASRNASPLPMMLPGDVPAQGKSRHRSQKPGGL